MAQDENNNTYSATQNESETTHEEAKEELTNAIEGSTQVLATATTVWPMTMFPDTITIDREKVTIATRSFFKTAEVMSTRIEDILNVTANVGPLFGSIKIVSRIFSPDRPYTIDHLWKADALRIKRVMQGYIIALKKDIDCQPLATEELSNMLDELGKDDH